MQVPLHSVHDSQEPVKGLEKTRRVVVQFRPLPSPSALCEENFLSPSALCEENFLSPSALCEENFLSPSALCEENFLSPSALCEENLMNRDTPLRHPAFSCRMNRSKFKLTRCPREPLLDVAHRPCENKSSRRELAGVFYFWF